MRQSNLNGLALAEMLPDPPRFRGPGAYKGDAPRLETGGMVCWMEGKNIGWTPMILCTQRRSGRRSTSIAIVLELVLVLDFCNCLRTHLRERRSNKFAPYTLTYWISVRPDAWMGQTP
jgi:hypothetical protein